MLKKTSFSKILLLTLSLAAGVFSHAQIFQEYYSSNILRPDSSNVLALSLNSSVFFNNKEFFGVREEGYTLTGGYLQPVMQYNLNRQLTLGAGVHLLKYFGREDFEQVLPMIRIEYCPNDNFSLVLGSFNGGQNFGMPYPLYRFEKQFTGLVNNGILLDYHNDNLNSKLWIDWEQMILPNDTFQEMFTAGSSNLWTLYENDLIRINLPFWFVIHHKGGQINITDEPVVTKTDLAGGLELKRKFSHPFFRELSLYPQVFFDVNELKADNGYAFQPLLILRAAYLEAEMGMFYAHNFQSYWGNPLLFTGPSPAGNANEDPDRLDFLFKAGYVREIKGGASLVLRFESWYDTNINRFQYAYGLHLVINELFKIKSLSQ